MDITLEQVEKLKEKADVPYAAAKKALEFSGGNMLDAMIYLEETGYLTRPQGGNFSTQEAQPLPPPEPAAVQAEPQRERGRRSFLDWLKWLGHLVVDNELEVWHRERMHLSVPVIIPGILVITMFWITIPIWGISLLLGFRYRVSGPGLEQENLNDMLRSMADTAAEVGRKVMEEVNIHQKKQKGRQNQEKPQDSEPG